MPTPFKRSTKDRALQKLQILLNRGQRMGVSGLGNFVWRGTMAVWRNAYDLGASKHGGLVLDLDAKHRIVGVRFDDTGPAWNTMDSEHPEWKNINSWASGLIHWRYETNDRPLPAHVFFAHMPEWNSRTLANRLLKDMAWEQWKSQPGMAALLQRMFDPSMDDALWRLRARQLSETLSMGLDKNSPDDVFFHRGVELNSKHLLAWTMAAGIVHAQQQGNEKETAYHNATVHATTNPRVQETSYEWYIQGDFSLPHVRLGDIFMARLTLPHTVDQPASVFHSIQPTLQYSNLTAQVRQEAVRKLYDVALGMDKAMAPDDAYDHVCNRICEGAKAMGAYNAKRLQEGVRTMADAWLAPYPSGQGLLQSLSDLMEWRDVLARNPKDALQLLVHAVRMAQQQKHQTSITINEPLFSSQDLLL